MMIKIQHKINRALEEFSGQILDDVTFANIKDVLVDSLIEILEVNFNSEEFDVRFDKSQIYDGKTEVVPLNFISALWLQGIDISSDSIISTEDHQRYETDLAVYFWEENKLVIQPKDRRDLFSHQF